MKKSKRILLLSLCVALAVSVSACKPKDIVLVTEEETTEETTTEETTTEEETTEKETIEVKAASDDIYSFQMTLNDASYSLPATYSEFKENGWIAEKIEGETLPPNSRSSLVVTKKGEAQIYLYFVNTGEDVLPYEECLIGKVQLSGYDAKKGAVLVLPKGITIGSSSEDIQAVYGEPGELRETDSLINIVYSLDSYSSVKLTVDKATNEVNNIDIENLVKKEKAAVVDDSSKPDVISGYKTPGSLGENWDTFNVNYGGGVYHLPAPMTAFLENGWVMVSDENESLAAKTSNVRVEIRKDNQVLKTTVYNYADTAQPLKFCFVTSVMYYNNGAKVSLELPKGISEKSTIEDVLAAYGEPSKKDTSASYEYYTYGKIWEEIVIMIETNTKEIQKIEVTHSPKTAY